MKSVGVFSAKVLCKSVKSVGEHISRKRILWENLSSERDLFPHALVLAILRWRHAEVALRELAEKREVGEAEIADILKANM